MKVSVVITILVVVYSSQADAAPTNDVQFAVESPWKELLEMLREFLINGYPEAGIAPMDPLEITHMNLDLPGDIFNIKANIHNGILKGLSDFKVNKFEFSKGELSVDYDVYFPSLNLSAEHYEMEGDIINAFPLAGRGILYIEIYDITINSKIYLKSNDEKVLVDRFENPGFSVSRIISKTQYDGNFDGILNAMVEDLLAGYLNRFNKFIAGTLTDRIIDPINEMLSNL